MTTSASATTVPSAQRASAAAIAGALALDAILIVVFAAIGRGSHAREATLLGPLETAWPFLAGLAISWLLALAWRRPAAILRTGLPVWIGTVALGMLFRALTGQGTALPFVIVATLTVGAFLLGWRLIALLVSRGRSRAAAGPQR
ncbi:DUF3054 domain-containing protein [Leucobacter aridicollis]|uniref:DUF3054 domain-containing protein n=1 Tax=Leucobacter aridicollis TaxID=283878 RepID=A0A852R7E8_9MICO|nr:DUF3054 domain-containing protein [Leucobacter aridicollis]NYD27365.1 hypothetical protein [Leucobacter aridicollis]